ncbi:MAG: antibiotic biosynthesis monooxygenase [Chlamydiia bacterium]|nr:antibiotic biosynthesis monooxygenase [Chlamydiia bacterium]
MTPHHVIVFLEAKEGKEDLLKDALMNVAKKSRAEEGCLDYQVIQDKSTPQKFGLVEKWQSQEVHQEQFSKPYILEFAKQAESWLAKPFEALFGHQCDASH